jgi:hypothetical protein
MIQGYKTMTADQLRTAMLAVIPADTWENLEQSPQNINWMYVVWSIYEAESAQDLSDLLELLNQHYAGPISIHEGWGGLEADSNLEIITGSIQFDMQQGFIDENDAVYRWVIELGWV